MDKLDDRFGQQDNQDSEQDRKEAKKEKPPRRLLWRLKENGQSVKNIPISRYVQLSRTES